MQRKTVERKSQKLKLQSKLREAIYMVASLTL